MLPLLPDPWFLVPVNAIGAMRSTVHTRVLDDAEVSEMLRRTRLGYHRAVPALAAAGNDVIMDYPLSEQWRVDDLLDTLTGYDVTLVEVRCAQEELDRRERLRGDRPVGLARSQTLVYAHGESDILVDTTNTDATECATAIVIALREVSSPKRSIGSVTVAIRNSPLIRCRVILIWLPSVSRHHREESSILGGGGSGK